MSSDTAISVRGLSKAYTIQKGGLEKQSTLAEAALARIANPLKRAEKVTFEALTDIDLEIKKGEVVGIIGRNGAGKSTLLKVLSRITYPTKGEIDIYGRVGSLLEVGTGFHPELTGKENIYLNGTILGMTRPEIKRAFDEIVHFAGVEKFLETPVKRYSSGMYVRLAFAVAAHLSSEILIVDEVLAVGDAEFQRKCIGKMQEVASGQGRSVVFVSHQMQTVRQLCDRAISLTHGKISHSGSVDKTINFYLNEINDNSDAVTTRIPPKAYGITSVALESYILRPNDDLVIDLELGEGAQPTDFHEKVFISVEISDGSGQTIIHLDSRALAKVWDSSEGHRQTITVTRPRLAPGRYYINLFACGFSGILDRFEKAAVFDTADEVPYPDGRPAIVANSMFHPDFDIKAKQLSSLQDAG